MRSSSLFGALLIAIVCAGAALAAGPAAGKNVKVGVIADVTGSAGAYGTAQRNAYDLAADDLKSGKLDAGGANLTFDVSDAASDPAQVVTLTQKYSTDGSALLIGPTLSGEAKKSDPIAVQAGLTILATSNTAQGITAMGPCVFRNSLAEEQVVPEAVDRIVRAWKPKTAAIIYADDNQFTKTDYEIFRDALTKRGVDIVDVETYHTNDVDYKAQLTKIAEKNPDVLVVGSLVQDAVKIIAQAKQIGLRAKMIGGNGLNSPQLMQLAGNAADGVVVGAAYFVGNNYAGNHAFVERYTKKFGSAPDQFAAQAYAAAQIVARLVKGGVTTSDGFCTGFRTLPIVDTVLGPIAFEPSRDVRAASAILQVSRGQFTYFK